MRKYFPLFILAFTFTAFVTTQMLFDYFTTTAEQVSKEVQINTHYEELYKTSSFTTLDGKTIELQKVKSKIVILNFWATWCNPCLEELPSLVKLQNKYPTNNLTVLAINADEGNARPAVLKMQKKLDLNFPIILDEKGKISELFKIQAVPVTIIYNQGKVIEVRNGPKDFTAGEFIEKINSLLAQH